MTKKKSQKKYVAEKILKKEKKKLLDIITNNPENLDNFSSERDFLYFIEEDAKYKIKKLNLSEKLEKYYLNKISDVYGEYSEDQPSKKGKFYYDEFYTNKKGN